LEPVSGIPCYKSKRFCCLKEFGHGYAPNADYCLARDEWLVAGAMDNEVGVGYEEVLRMGDNEVKGGPPPLAERNPHESRARLGLTNFDRRRDVGAKN